MLRALPGQAASPVRDRTRCARAPVARTTPVLRVPDTSVGLRGRMPSGRAAALIAGPSGFCLVSVDRAGRRRVRRFTIPEVVVVEEQRIGRTCEVQIVTLTATFLVADVDPAQAWFFCRELRAGILASAPEPLHHASAAS